MASYTFKWPHAANEVYVTGTFDDWAKSEKLSPVNGVFEKTVVLSKVSDKIYYKFVVDGNWTTDHLAPSETDSSGNVNNVLLAEHLSAADTNISSVAPGATTAALAGGVPLEAKKSVPGQFPEESSEQTYSVNPLPATAGAGNPIILAPGQTVPASSSYTTSTLDSNVRLDQASYEKSGSTVPQLPPVLNAQEQREAEGAAMFGTLSSVGPSSTTAGLAGQQPLQSNVPEIVTASQQSASVPGEATSSPQAVADKSQLEEELKEKVPEAPTTSESGTFGKSEAGILGVAAAGIAAVGTAVAGAAYAARDQLAESTGHGPTINSVAPNSTTNQLAGQQTIEPRGVPEVITESQEAAHASPEAADSAQAVQDKSFVESELKDKVPEAAPTSESGLLGKSERGYVGAAVGGAAAAGAIAAGAVAGAKDKIIEQTQPPAANGVPEVVAESQQQAHAAPEAAADATAVQEKSAVEQELLNKVHTTNETGTPAPTETEHTLKPKASAAGSGSVSPMTRPSGDVANGLDSAPATPKKDTLAPQSDSPSDAKKNKRRSFFGKIKDKLRS